MSVAPAPAQIQRKCESCQKEEQEAASSASVPIRRKYADCDEKQKIVQKKSTTFSSSEKPLSLEAPVVVRRKCQCEDEETKVQKKRPPAAGGECGKVRPNGSGFSPLRHNRNRLRSRSESGTWRTDERRIDRKEIDHAQLLT
jgi:hypothetical protein